MSYALSQDDVQFMIHATRMGFTNLDQIADVLLSSGLESDQSLSDLIEKHGLITVSQREQIEERIQDLDDQSETMASVIVDSAVSDGEVPVSDTSGVGPLLLEESGDDFTMSFDGRYNIIKEHSRGGQARIMLVQDKHLGRQVALKEVHTGERTRTASSSSERTTRGIARFLREARVTGRLEHPNIVPVHELGRKPDGSLYYTMRFVRGQTLSRKLKQCQTLEERLKLLGVFWDVARAIAYAHSRGVVHRDIKPLNIMVGEFNETVVLDWGIAKVKGMSDIQLGDMQEEIRQLAGTADMTVAGTTLGTPSYMSPEQAKGEIDEIDERSDVWGLGAMLYEILTGNPPYKGRVFHETIRKVLKEPLREVRIICPEVSPELAAVAQKALQRDRSLRYQSAKELADEVGTYMTGGRVSAYQYSSWELLKRFAAQNKAAVIAASFILLVIFVALVVVSFTLQEKNRAYESEKLALNQKEAALLKEQDERRTANYHLAQAYAGKARQLMGDYRFLGAEIMMAVSLLHNPAHPQRPYYQPDFVKKFPQSRDLMIWGASSIYVLGLKDSAEIYRRLKAEHGLSTMCFTPDGQYLVTGSYTKNKVLIWDVDENRSIREFEGLHVACSPDGRLVATGTEGKLMLWDFESGKKIWTMQSDTARDVKRITFTPDGSLLATSYRGDGIIRMWRVDNGRPHKSLKGHKEAVYGLDISADGRLLASSSSDKTIRIWDLASGRTLRVLTGHANRVTSVNFSPDGKLLASTGMDKTVKIWEVASGRMVRAIENLEAGQFSVTFSPDGTRLASASMDRPMHLFDVKSGQRILTVKCQAGFLYDVAFSPKGDLVAASSEDGSVVIWRLKPARMISLKGHEGHVGAIRFSPDGLLVATGSWDKTIRVWEKATGRLVHLLRGHTQLLAGLDFSPDSKKLASAAFDRTARIWDVKTGRCLHVLEHQDNIQGIAYSPDGKLLATGSQGARIVIWDTEEAKSVRVIEGHKNPVRNLTFFPDGRKLASVSWDKTVGIWDPNTGKRLKSLSGHKDNPEAVAVSPDGKLIASAGTNGQVILWDANTGKKLNEFDGIGVRFSADGSMLVTTDGVWRISDAQQLFRLEAWVMDLAQDGSMVIADGQGQVVNLYSPDFSVMDADPQRLIEEAKKRAGLKLEGFELIPRTDQ